MEKNLRFFTEDAILHFKNNKEEFCQKMRENPKDISWIDDYFKNATVASGYTFDFEFLPFTKIRGEDEDYENAVRLYELFKQNNIRPAVIYNEKFITGFAFTFGYEYFMNLTGAKTVSSVFDDLFFSSDVHRSVARNYIARLYRYVEMTIDEDAENPYWLTRFAFSNPNVLRIKYYTSKDGENTHKAFFKAFKEWKDETGKDITSNLVEKVRKHLGVLSNISDTDLMSEESLVEYLKLFLNKVGK